LFPTAADVLIALQLGPLIVVCVLAKTLARLV
jgi:hypothetical protein